MFASSLAQFAVTAWRRSMPGGRTTDTTDIAAAWRRTSRCCPDCEYSWVVSPADETCMFCGSPGVPGRLDDQGGVRPRP